MEARSLVFWGFAIAMPGVLWGQARPPHLFLTEDQFAHINQQADAVPWKASVRSAILQSAGKWPAAQVAQYGLREWVLPPEGGQWSLWYVCPVHGLNLQFEGPGENRCPVDNKNFTGWPYDQVIYARRHSDNANAARDNGLAYRFTGNFDNAKAAARILLAYADLYSSYPIHDKNGKNTTSGARVCAQTLDESSWLIPIAWAYDLIADSAALDPAQRTHIEQDLLRPAAGIIARNGAGTSNWQSWHNAAIGAAGYTLNDRALISKALDDSKNGFRFQMKNSVLADGLWLEGAWGYHFFALDPIVQLALMAAQDGTDLFSSPSLRKMFEAPIQLSLPDWTLPPFSDSGNVSVLGYDRLYEIAFKQYGDPLYSSVLGTRARGREALFWGVESLPDTAPPERVASIFPASGNAALRSRDTDHTVIMKFGPDGGWHGHYDKLNFISYARGGIMAVDPGTVSYAAPTHETWDKMTVAHNTVVVDQKSQAPATGKLLQFAINPYYALVTADAGAAYKQASLQRTLLHTADYTLDIFQAKSLDGAPHQFDWIYHNYGAANTALPLQPYSSFPKVEGYQHLTETNAAVTDQLWQAEFDMNGAAESSVGSIYVNKSTIAAGFRYSREQAASGSFSGKMTYDFSADQGYILYSVAAPADQPKEIPLGVSMWIYGDNSGHKLTLRFNDSTDERFTTEVGTINWTGWKLIGGSAPESWSHYLGNDDGKIDLPLKSVTIQLDSVGGAPVTGALYVDDITVDYPSRSRVMAADFEKLLRYLRVIMGGAPDTTVVVGKGLGPDLLKPVPFVMARRYASEALFVAAFEPHGGEPRIESAQSMPDGTIRVEGSGFFDTVSVAEANDHCPVTVTRYFKECGRPRVSWKGCRPGKSTPRKP